MKKVIFVKARLCKSVIKHVSFFVLMLLQQGNLIAQNAVTENPSVKLENTTQQEINSNLFQLPVLTDQERDKITNPQEGTVIYNKSSKKPQFFNGHRWIYFDNSHGGEDYFGSYRYIGESYGGGIIFYLDSTGQHGLICSPFDLSAKATWGFFKEQVAAHDLSIGSGFTNTEKIVRASKKQDIAAYI